MKKIVLLIATVMTLTMSANAQWLDFANNNKRFGIGFQFGNSGFGTEYSNLGFGMSLNAMGAYIDFLVVNPEHQYDNHVIAALYDDTASFAINAGYQVPILPWLRVAPIVGYYQTNYGKTDASTVNIESGEYSSTMYHDYNVTPGSRKHHFNYGIGLFVQPFSAVELYAVGTRHAIYGGISINLGHLMQDID